MTVKSTAASRIGAGKDVALKAVKKEIFKTDDGVKKIFRELQVFHLCQNYKHINHMLDFWAPNNDNFKKGGKL
jgi:serine/threonine protein kinase